MQGVKRGVLENAVKVVFLMLMALIYIASSLLFLLFFIPIIGWFVWRAHDKAAELEKRVAALEKPEERKPEQP